MTKQPLNEEFKRMQQLAGIITESYLDEANGEEKFKSTKKSNLNEKYPSGVWDWDINEFGEYNPSTRTFEIFMDGDGFGDYMDTEFPGWLENEDITDEGRKKFLKDIRNAVKEEYGPGVKIEGEGFSY